MSLMTVGCSPSNFAFRFLQALKSPTEPEIATLVQHTLGMLFSIERGIALYRMPRGMPIS
jgi:hypothetical protein